MRTPLFLSSRSSYAFRPLVRANVFAAFAVLLLIKIALALYTVSGAEGETAWGATLGKTFGLCLGYDILGAVTFGLLASLLAYPFGRYLRPALALAVSLVLQTAHVVYLWVSYYVTQAVGSPLEKAAIDLAFLNSDAKPGAAANASTPIWDSVGPYLKLPNMTFLTVLLLVMLVHFVWFYRRPLKLSTFWRRTALALATIMVMVTVLILPAIRNGEYLGVRIHTLGLERSHALSLAASYLREPLRELYRSESRPSDPFCLNPDPTHPAVEEPGAAEPQKNPLAEALPKKTNLLFVLLESVAATYLPEPMPYLDSLGKKCGGVTFTHHYTTWPMTIQSLFSIFCSELPHPDYAPITQVNPAIPCVSLSEALKNSGYDTALFTSQDLGYDRQMRFFKHRRFDVIHDMNDMPGKDEPGILKNNWGIEEKATQKALFDWIEQRRAQTPAAPFFAFYQMGAPHHPYRCPGQPEAASTDNDAEFKAYTGCLNYVDAQLKALFDTLEAKKLRDDTLVVIVSDHGEGFSQHYGGQGRSHGSLLYDEFIHTPLIMTGPQLAKTSGAVEFATNHLDLAPTLLGLLDLQIPLTMKGRDLTRDASPRVQIAGSRPPTSQVAIIDWPYKAILTQETNTSELFDLSSDPRELRNLASEKSKILLPMLRRLQEWDTQGRYLIENYAAVLRQSGRICRPVPVVRAPSPPTEPKAAP